MKRHIVDRLLKLLSVSRELLDAGFTVQVPQTDGAVMTCRGGDELQVVQGEQQLKKVTYCDI